MAGQHRLTTSNAQRLAMLDGCDQQLFVRFDLAPEAWLRLLVDDKELLDDRSLQNLMATSWAVCEAVLSCMAKRHLLAQVRVRALLPWHVLWYPCSAACLWLL